MSHHHDPHQAWCTSLCVAPPAWPAPTDRRKHVRLIGGPDGGTIAPLTGTHLVATSAIFANGYIHTPGIYAWEVLNHGEIVGVFYEGKYW